MSTTIHKLTFFPGVLPAPNGNTEPKLFIDANTVINLLQLGAADFLLRANRQIVFTEELMDEFQRTEDPTELAAHSARRA